MRVVSNTSPLSNLAIIGQLELLGEQFKTVWIPQAVLMKLARLTQPEAKKRLFVSQEDGWLQVRSLTNPLITALLSGHSDQN